MKKFRDFAQHWLRQNGIVLIFALLVGTLSVLPHLLAVYALGNEYKGVPFMYEDNEDYYLTRIREITEGNFFVGSAYFNEYKNTLPIIFPIGEYFYYALYLISGISLAHTLVLAKFLFPLVLFLLVYTLVTALTKEGGEKNLSIWSAIATGLMVTLGIELTEYHTLFSRLLNGTNSEVLSMWTRPVNPITGGIMLFAFLNLLWRSMLSPSWKNIVFAGVLLGLSIGYIFSFALAFAILGILFLLALIAKEYAIVKRFAFIGTIGLAIPALYWVNVLPQLESSAGLAGRNGLMLMHTPLLNKILIAACLLFGLLLLLGYKKADIRIIKEYKKYLPLWFAAALLLGGLVVLNQQILTGRTIWPFHFVQYTIPLAMVALYTGIHLLLRPIAPRIWKALICASIASCIIFSLWNATTYARAMNDFHKLQDFASPFSWLNINAPADCVVLVHEDTAERLSRLTPAFTHCDIYFTSYLTGGAIPSERIEHNFFTKLRIDGVNANTIDQYLEQHQEELVTYFYKDWFELFGLKKTDRIHSLTPEIASDYREFMKQDFEKELARYRIDYIIARDPLAPETKKDLPHWSEAVQLGSTTIYSFHP